MRKSAYTAVSVLVPILIIATLALVWAPSGLTSDETAGKNDEKSKKEATMSDNEKKNDELLRQKLTPEQYEVTQMCGTEPPFTGKYYKHDEDGTYHCVVCDNPLFGSNTKYESGSGWPSFFQPVGEGAVNEKPDTSHGMVRTEITCGKCGAHLGHVFEDGPRPTGLRYCINSVALNFEKDSTVEQPSAHTEEKK